MTEKSVLKEARPYFPFKSADEYLVAMREDLAEWLLRMYPELEINYDNFFEKLWTGVALCKHANAVKEKAIEYVQRKQQRIIMSRSITGSVQRAETIISIPEVKYFDNAKAGTFFARDNVCNFINWCRKSLRIIECLLFESDDLIMQKNEKHVILCLLEVGRQGAKYGMMAPMLVQMERQIDREIAAEQKRLNEADAHNDAEDEESDLDDDEENQAPILHYGPVPQIVTNDLKSLDEMVRDLVAKCTCPTQFPVIRVAEGKYKIGDTKVLIFVRILRNHVMVRVGGGWDTLAHYLDKHDPCRCRSQHRATQGARLIPRRADAVDLHGSHVHYNRDATPAPPPAHLAPPTSLHGATLGPPTHALNRSRSRSPSAANPLDDDHHHRTLPSRRSRSPTPYFTSTHEAKIAPPPPPIVPKTADVRRDENKTTSSSTVKLSEVALQIAGDSTDHSDTTSEVSDEGYRSLGLVNGDKKQEHLEPPINTNGLRVTNFSSIYTKKPTRAASLDRPQVNPIQKTQIKTTKVVKTSSPTTTTTTTNGTWSGRGKTTRSSLTNDTFTASGNLSPRNSLGRRSSSSLESRTRSKRTPNASPTHAIKDEVLQALKTDDPVLLGQLRSVVEKYREGSGGEVEFRRDSGLRGSVRSPRRDSRQGAVTISRIPAPILN